MEVLDLTKVEYVEEIIAGTCAGCVLWEAPLSQCEAIDCSGRILILKED